ncbi:catalase [Saccharibacillus sp. O16]|nr:catalase [Saccharibacillus sp. O16]
MFSESESPIETSHLNGTSADAKRPPVQNDAFSAPICSTASDVINPTSHVGADCGGKSLRSVCYRASFRPSGKAAPFTTSAHLQGSELAAIVRFSGSSSPSLLADLLSPAKGMAVQFLLPNGTPSSLIGITVPVFFARTPKSLRDMLATLKQAKNGQLPKSEALRRFALYFDESRQGFLALHRLKPPASYATCLYYCVHAYYLVDEQGCRRPVKFEWLPDAGVHTLTRHEATAQPDDYLEQELELRLREHPVSFKLDIVFGEEGDPIDDPTKRWPANRPRVEAGRLVLLEPISEPEDLMIDPTIVPEGMALSEDPILRFNPGLYLEPLKRCTPPTEH